MGGKREKLRGLWAKCPSFPILPPDSEQRRQAGRWRRRSPARWSAAAARGEGGREGALEGLIPRLTSDYGGLWRWLRGGRRAGGGGSSRGGHGGGGGR